MSMRSPNKTPTLEYFNTMKEDWEKSGLLEGLSGKPRDMVTEYFNEVDFELLDYIEGEFDIKTYILPSIRRIVSMIEERGENEHISEHVFGVSKEELYLLVDVKEITGLLNVYSQGFIPFAEKFLPHIDAQAESVRLFCENYVFKLIDRVKGNKYKT